MSVLPENEKVIKLDQDDEGWVDTHHGISELHHTNVSVLTPFASTAIEQMQEKVTEMKLEGEKETVPVKPVSAVPLVGGATGLDDSDTDSEPAVDIDDFQEEEDPVSYSKKKNPTRTDHAVCMYPCNAM